MGCLAPRILFTFFDFLQGCSFFPLALLPFLGRFLNLFIVLVVVYFLLLPLPRGLTLRLAPAPFCIEPNLIRRDVVRLDLDPASAPDPFSDWPRRNSSLLTARKSVRAECLAHPTLLVFFPGARTERI